MKAGRVCLAMVWALTSSHASYLWADSAPHTADKLQKAVQIYTEIRVARKLFAYMKIEASSEDQAYLDKMSAQVREMELPKLTVSKGGLQVQGLPKIVQVVDLARRLYSYNGKTLDLSASGDGGLEATVRTVGNVLFPEDSTAWNWIFPRAHADMYSLLAIVGGLVGVAGLASSISCFDSSGSSANANCGAGLLMGAGGFLAAFMALNAENKAKQVQCSHGQAVLMGPTNNVLYTTSVTASGQAVLLPTPTAGMVPIGSGSTLASGFLRLCSNPTMLTTFNNSLSVVPMAPTPFVPPGYQYNPINGTLIRAPQTTVFPAVGTPPLLFVPHQAPTTSGAVH